MNLNDIHCKSIDVNKIIRAYTRDNFTVEVLLTDNSIQIFKYDDLTLMEQDVIKMNLETPNQVLCE